MSKYGNSSYWLKDWEDDDIVVDTMKLLDKSDRLETNSVKQVLSGIGSINHSLIK